MGLLYTVASRVVVWMGDERPEDYRAIEVLNEVQKESESEEEESYLYTNDLKQIESLLGREWFTRMWIIQELVLGSNVVVKCGTAEIEWDDFMDGIVECEKLLNSNSQDENIHYLRGSFRAHALHRGRNLYKKRQLFSFLELRKMFFPNRSSRPRDKLFSLLHLAWDLKGATTGFQPDYDSDDNDVLARFTQWLITISSVPAILYWAGNSKSSSFCSWIPNLMCEKGPYHYEYPETISQWEAKTNFSSGTRLRMSKSHPFDVITGKITLQPKPILTIAGALIDSIQECGSLDASRQVTHFYKVLDDVRKYISKLDCYPGYVRDWRDEVLIKTLIGDAPGPLMISSLPYFDQPKQTERWPQGFESEITQIRLDQDAHLHASRSPESQLILSQFRATSATFLRKFPSPKVCITEEGFVGIVPGAQPGDKILIIRDSKVPFIVRKVNQGDNFYSLVGEAYVHGLMYYRDVREFVHKHRIETEEINIV
ncbi:hypothetical protein ABW20_dc0102668 [Dactylellina cionopaga]|nr:hypothetical protein ABW20_dc0102668 [Dactylellina cionopaga]